MTDGTRIIEVGDLSLPAVKAFLGRYPETSLFLLSNIRAFGTRLGESMYSANLKAIKAGEEIRAVFCLTRGGSLLAQTGGREIFVDEILGACRAEGIPIRGVLGEWTITSAIWARLKRDDVVKPTYESKEVAYRLELTESRPGPVDERRPGPFGPGDISVRMLSPEDQMGWQDMSAAFTREVGLPLQGTEGQRRAAFVRSAGLRHWWGAFDGGELVAIAGITATYEKFAQIGGVYTVPARRRSGISRAIMMQLVADSRDVHGLELLFLFTGENNVAARAMYESIGFRDFGHFGLFFGE